MNRVLLTVAAVALAATTQAQAVWTGPSGGGMMSVQEAFVLEKDKVTFGMVQDSYDRDPLGIDVDEFRFAGRIGLGRRTEVFGWYYYSHPVITPGPTPVPAPPLDIVVASGPSPRVPYRPMYWPLPYLGHTAAGVMDMVPGDAVLGLKTQIAKQSGFRPAVSVSTYAMIPTTRTGSMLRRGANSGSLDFCAQSAATWSYGRASLSLDIGVTRLSDVVRSDRIIDASGIHDEKIHRPYVLRLASGMRVRVYRNVSLMTEVFQLSYIGPHTPMQDESGTTDAIVGLQWDYRRLSFTIGYRQHLSPAPNDVVRPTGPLAGAVDLSKVSLADRATYLSAISAPGQGIALRHSVVITGAPGDVPLPYGATRLPATYVTSTTGNGGTVLALTIRF